MNELNTNTVVTWLRMHFPDVQTAEVIFAEEASDERAHGLAAEDIRDEPELEPMTASRCLGVVLKDDEERVLLGFALNHLYLREEEQAGGVKLTSQWKLELCGGLEDVVEVIDDTTLVVRLQEPSEHALMEPTTIRAGDRFVVILPRQNRVARAYLLPQTISAPDVDSLLVGRESPPRLPAYAATIERDAAWVRQTYAELVGQGEAEPTRVLSAVAMVRRLNPYNDGSALLAFAKGEGEWPDDPGQRWLLEQRPEYLRQLSQHAAIRAEALADRMDRYGEDDELPEETMLAMAREREELQWALDALTLTDTPHTLLEACLESIDRAGNSLIDGSYTAAGDHDVMVTLVRRANADGWWSLREPAH